MRGLAAALLVVQLTVPYASAQPTIPAKGFDITFRKPLPGRTGQWTDVLVLESKTDDNLELSFDDIPVSLSTPIPGPVDPETGFAIFLPGRPNKLNVVKIVKTMTALRAGGPGGGHHTFAEIMQGALECMVSEDCIKWPGSKSSLHQDLTFTLWEDPKNKTPLLSFRLHGCFPTSVRSNTLERTTGPDGSSSNVLVEEITLNFQKIEFLALSDPNTQNTTAPAADPPPECEGAISEMSSSDFTVDIDYTLPDRVLPYFKLANLKGVRLKKVIDGDDKIFVKVQMPPTSVVRAYSMAGCRDTEAMVCDGKPFQPPVSSYVGTCDAMRNAAVHDGFAGRDCAGECTEHHSRVMANGRGDGSVKPAPCFYSRRQGLPETAWQHLEYHEVDPAEILSGLLKAKTTAPAAASDATTSILIGLLLPAVQTVGQLVSSVGPPTDAVLIGLLLPAVQKIRESPSLQSLQLPTDGILIGLLLPAFQKIGELNPPSDDVAISLLLPAVKKASDGKKHFEKTSRMLLTVNKRTFRTLDTLLLEAPILASSRAGIPEWLDDILTPSPTFPKTLPNPHPLYDSMLFGALNEILDTVVDLGDPSNAFTVDSFFDIFLALAVDHRAGSQDGWLVNSFFDIWTELRTVPGRAYGSVECAKSARAAPTLCSSLGWVETVWNRQPGTVGAGQVTEVILKPGADSGADVTRATGALASLMCCPMQTPYPCPDGSCASSEAACASPNTPTAWASWRADTFKHIRNSSIGDGWGRTITVSELVAPAGSTPPATCVARKTMYEGCFPTELHMPSFAAREFDSTRANYKDPTAAGGKTFRLKVKPTGLGMESDGKKIYVGNLPYSN